MTDSVFTGSVVVVGEVAAGRVGESVLPELPAVPDAGGEGEYSLADACPDPGGGVPAGFLERELAFERVVDRLDPLADPAELAEPGLLVAAIGADESGVEGRHGLLKLGASEAFIADDDLPAGET